MQAGASKPEKQHIGGLRLGGHGPDGKLPGTTNNTEESP